MDYVDYTLVRLADESLRAALFDQTALEQIALTAYDAEAMSLGPPYSAVFDDVAIGLAIPRRATAEAAWGPVTGGDRKEGRMTLFGLSADDVVRVDALWRGAVVARAVSPTAHIERVITSWPDANGIDDEIAASPGGTPQDPAALERERRKRLMARLRTGMRQPDALSDALFDRWLAQLGVSTVGELMAQLKNQLLTGTMQLQFSQPAGPDSSAPRRLPLTAAILVRDQPIHVAQLITDSKLIRDQLGELGAEPSRDPDSARRRPILIIWMVPDASFDDNDWPGGEAAGTPDARRQLRRLAASRWLAREGIALALTPAHKQ